MGTPKTDPDYEHSEAALREKDGRSLIERMTRWLDGSVEYRSTELIQEAVEELQALGMALHMTESSIAMAKAMRECCDRCDDGDGHCVFPYYGVAPHTHAPGPMVGSTRLLPKDRWGDNFREDPECPGQGVYMRCPHCGRGERPSA